MRWHAADKNAEAEGEVGKRGEKSTVIEMRAPPVHVGEPCGRRRRCSAEHRPVDHMCIVCGPSCPGIGSTCLDMNHAYEREQSIEAR